MRPKTLILISIMLALLALAACDAPGLPPTATATPPPNPAPTGTAETLEPTNTAIAGRPTATGAPTVIAGTSATPQPEGTPSKDPRITEVERQTVELRGLEPKKEVQNNIISREKLSENLLEDFKKEYSREEARTDAVELWMLRLIEDRSLDLYQLYLDFYTESIGGYYDPEVDTMYIIAEDEPGEKLSPRSRQVVAHEYVHALQDQHYDLEKMLPEDSTEYDRDLARRSLVEGDAERTDLMYAFQYFTREEFNDLLQGSGDPTPAFDSAPAYIREGFIFPYTKGVLFADQLLDAPGGFENINKALADPPKSTEQIIHPDKYMDNPRDDPEQVTLKPLTDTLGSGWKYSDGGTFGEFDIDLMLTENGVPGVSVLDFDAAGKDAEKAAAGWDGGHYALYENGEQALLLLDTVWDNSREADEYRRALEQTFGGASRDGDYYSDGGRLFAMGGDGERVFLISSTDKGALDKVVAAVR